MLSINIADVIAVLQTMIPQLIILGVALVAAIIVTICAMKAKKPLKGFIRKEAWIAFLLVVVVVANTIVLGPMFSMINMAMGGGKISDDAIAEAKELCTDIAEEGIVLLKNDDKALPLAEGAKVNVFGWSSTNPIYGGTGSGALSDAYPTVDFLTGLTDAGIEYNQDLVDFYKGWRDARPTVGMMGQDWTIPEPKVSEYGNLISDAKNYSDTAIFFIARSGGEGADLPASYDGEDTFSTEGMFGASGVRYSDQKDDLDASKSYLELSNREQALLDEVTANFDKVIVVVNSANAMELGFVNNYSQIKSVLYCPGTGQTGFDGLGEIIAGQVNPSGKTADTFVADLFATPTANNFGDFDYTNMEEFGVDNMFAEGGKAYPTFVNYVEGIYVGYKFYETAAAEAENGFEFDYDSAVVYPFGYGLSYTTFKQEMGPVTNDGKTVSFDVTVTNTGDVAGKDVVEVYYNPPYTNGGIEKAAANLIQFAKTQTLEPGASETVSISFALEDMASYDTYGKGCYVLEAGDYEISINSDSHNKIATDTVNVASDIVYDESNKRESDAVAATNQFGFAEGDVTYLSRADGFANYAEATAAPTSFELADEYKSAYVNNNNYKEEDYNNSSDEMPTTEAKNGIELKELRGLDYDDPKWEELLDEMSVADMNTLIELGGYETSAIKSIDKVMTYDCDGPASINNNFTGQGSIGFPAAVMIACTWNKDMALAFGQSIGRMANDMDVSGWYAPATNTHRSAFAGRNFEYYSEDGVLAGWMCANAVNGAREWGVYSYVKHFATNDQETNRTNLLCTWLNEQSMREIYLKSFEITFKNSNPGATMVAFNNIGTVPAEACPELLNDVLRGEWGFRGFAETDYFGGYGYQDADRMIRNGCDLMLATYSTDQSKVTDQTSATSVIAMRQASKNILYTVVNSRAYDNDIKAGLPTWEKVLILIDVILGLLIVCLEYFAIKKYLAKRKEMAPTVEAE
ncbi:MAG: glycoside hydrolase family 3 C-terminal domain-containing protein [Pseudobutyrivibrio sp.]|uniref:glycoside hydrolase family 3 protein n=1 Tax=Pseudobutyrivibrio sp. TaxID=2014367 RepID=UPI0025E1201E|nr:glycoside hydrolase family 3 protein [Pseudobutyrivibrio sp.]MBQ8488404.1 glycoside hydrolase family 3 C-terminal domain-containing protein [Pseudobutyrivibrio sp.]